MNKNYLKIGTLLFFFMGFISNLSAVLIVSRTDYTVEMIPVLWKDKRHPVDPLEYSSMPARSRGKMEFLSKVILPPYECVRVGSNAVIVSSYYYEYGGNVCPQQLIILSESPTEIWPAFNPPGLFFSWGTHPNGYCICR